MDTADSVEQPIDSHSNDTKSQPQSSKRLASDSIIESSLDSDSSLSLEEGNKRARHEVGSSTLPTVSTDRPAQLERRNDGFIPPYNSMIEGLPKVGPYHPNFKLAEEANRDTCDTILHVRQELKDNGYVNDEIDNVCGDPNLSDYGLSYCRNPSNFYPTIKSVVVLGPAGSGKSSALNSLMDQAQTAYAHDGEDRGTYLVHEFRGAHRTQTSCYCVEVLFYAAKENRRQVRRRFADIMKHLSPDEEQDVGEDDEDSLSLQKYETAIGFFSDIFPDRNEFQTEKHAIDFFNEMEPDSEDEVLAKLLEYLDELLASRSLDVDQKESYTAENGTELHAILKSVARPFKRHQVDRKPCPWPLIRKVVIRQNLRLLDTGVVLADTPGTNDTDLIVAENTRSYLKQAGTILIFLPYKRISKNPVLGQLLRTCITSGKMHDTYLVVTMIDEMHSLDEDSKDALSAQDKETLHLAEAQVKELEHQIAQIEEDQIQARAGGDPTLFMQLDSQIRCLRLQLGAAEAAVKQTTIEIRCGDIRKQLKDSIRAIERSRYAPDLPVYFVSNKIYQQHVAGFKNDKPPDLTVWATGIPELRRQIFTIPARGRLEKLTGLYKNRLPSSIDGIEGILTKSTMERKTEVRSILRTALDRKENPMSHIIEELRSAFENEVIATTKSCKNQWCQEIEQKLFPKWEAIHAQTFQGLCLRQGDWNHKKLGDLQLNAEILGIFAPKLMKFFNEYDDRVSGIESDIKRNVTDHFANVRIEVEQSSDAAGQNLASFFQFIKNSREMAIEDLSKIFDDFRDKVAHIRHCTTIDTEDTYHRLSMSAVYETCRAINSTNYQNYVKGESSNANKPKVKTATQKVGKRRTPKKSPVTSARLQTMHNKLWGKCDEISLFDDIGRAAKRDLDAALGEYKTRCDNIVQRVKQNILKDFEHRFCEPKVKAEENPEAVAQWKAAVQKAKEVLNGPFRMHLEECYKYEGRVFPGSAAHCGEHGSY